MLRWYRAVLPIALALILGLSLVPALAQSSETLTIYSGRNEELIAPLLEQFTAETGVQVEVRYAGTTELAAQIVEEGANSPADVFIAQDAGGLGLLAQNGLLAALPSDVLDRVPAQFSSQDGVWLGVSARARVLVYNPVLLAEAGLELPASILDLTGEQWRGRVGWAPTNASFQSNITAMRVLLGDDATRAWLEGMVANEAVFFDGNMPLNEAVANGEVLVGITNHYYMFRILAETPDANIAQHFFPNGDAGSLINVAGAGILASSDTPGLAQRFLLYLVGSSAQQYFANSTYEYPLIDGIAVNERLTPLSSIQPPAIDLSSLADLEASLVMIEESGALD